MSIKIWRIFKNLQRWSFSSESYKRRLRVHQRWNMYNNVFWFCLGHFLIDEPNRNSFRPYFFLSLFHPVGLGFSNFMHMWRPFTSKFAQLCFQIFRFSSFNEFNFLFSILYKRKKSKANHGTFWKDISHFFSVLRSFRADSIGDSDASAASSGCQLELMHYVQ